MIVYLFVWLFNFMKIMEKCKKLKHKTKNTELIKKCNFYDFVEF